MTDVELRLLQALERIALALDRAYPAPVPVAASTVAPPKPAQ